MCAASKKLWYCRQSPISVILIQPCQIRKWMNHETDMEKKVKMNVKAVLMHARPGILSHELKEKLNDWVLQQLEAKMAVLTALVIGKALSIESSFKKRNYKKPFSLDIFVSRKVVTALKNGNQSLAGTWRTFFGFMKILSRVYERSSMQLIVSKLFCLLCS